MVVYMNERYLRSMLLDAQAEAKIAYENKAWIKYDELIIKIEDLTRDLNLLLRSEHYKVEK